MQALDTDANNRWPDCHTNLRREPRFNSNGTTYVTDLNDLTCVEHLGAVVDVSTSGLQLELDVQLPPGAHLKIQLNQTVVIGEVKNIHQHGDRYRVGIHLTIVCGCKQSETSSTLLALSQAVSERRRFAEQPPILVVVDEPLV